MAVALGDRLVQQGKPVAHGAIGGAGDGGQALRLNLHALGRGERFVDADRVGVSRRLRQIAEIVLEQLHERQAREPAQQP